jgi:DNA-binding MarR family transcriptional regulator
MKSIISEYNKIFESRIRLGIMSILAVNDGVDFTTIKDLLDITDGNLASHLNILEKSKYLTVSKQFLGKKPNTRYTSTELGTKAFKEHLNYLEKLIKNHQ